jgi:hypothetical protein
MVPFYLLVMSEGQSALGDPVDQTALPIFRGVARWCGLGCVIAVAVLWGAEGSGMWHGCALGGVDGKGYRCWGGYGLLD